MAAGGGGRREHGIGAALVNLGVTRKERGRNLTRGSHRPVTSPSQCELNGRGLVKLGREWQQGKGGMVTKVGHA